MTYNKPSDKTYVDMCIYFDEHIYDDPEVRNDSLLYQYLYHIIYMLSCKLKFFEGPNSFERYDKFSLWAATKIYMRCISNTNPETRIKSVLNYAKAVISRMKVDWLKETFNDILGHQDGHDPFYKLQESMEESVRSDYYNIGDLMDDVVMVFNRLTEITYKAIDRTPYKAEPVLRKRLAVSVMLTLVNQVTVPQSIDGKEATQEDKYALAKKDRGDKVILWRLGQSFHNLVHVLAVEVRKECSDLVGVVRSDYEMSDEDVTSILMTAYGNVARDNNEEF